MVTQITENLNGTAEKYTRKYTRVGTGNGLMGEWQSESYQEDPTNKPRVLEVKIFEKDGLTFQNSMDDDDVSLRFDGNPYQEKGPDVAKDSVLFGKRLDAHKLEIVNEVARKKVATGSYELSETENTLTITWGSAKTGKFSVSVFDRQPNR